MILQNKKNKHFLTTKIPFSFFLTNLSANSFFLVFSNSNAINNNVISLIFSTSFSTPFEELALINLKSDFYIIQFGSFTICKCSTFDTVINFIQHWRKLQQLAINKFENPTLEISNEYVLDLISLFSASFTGCFAFNYFIPFSHFVSLIDKQSFVNYSISNSFTMLTKDFVSTVFYKHQIEQFFSEFF